MKITRYFPPFSLLLAMICGPAIWAVIVAIGIFVEIHSIPRTGLESNLVEHGLTIQPGQTLDVSIPIKHAAPEERPAKESPSDEWAGGGSAFPTGESWTTYRRKDGSSYIVRATKEEMKKARDAEAAEEAHRRDLFQALKTRALSADERKEALGYRDRLNIEPNTPYFAADKTRELNEAWVVQARIQTAAEAPTAQAIATPIVLTPTIPITLSEATTSKPILFSGSTGSSSLVMKSPPGITLPKPSEITAEMLVNKGFEAGARISYRMARAGGTEGDLEFLIECFKASDINAVKAWIDERERRAAAERLGTPVPFAPGSVTSKFESK